MQSITKQSYYLISQLASTLGLNSKTIRYYETIGLLPQPQRSESGYRLYTQADVERLGFIQKAKTLGCSLEEISEILKMREDGLAPCTHVLAVLEAHIRAVETKIQALRDLRTTLIYRRDLASQCPDCTKAICSIIEYEAATQGLERISD